jgi:hypothetical protein
MGLGSLIISQFLFLYSKSFVLVYSSWMTANNYQKHNNNFCSCKYVHVSFKNLYLMFEEREKLNDIISTRACACAFQDEII